jgi:uncharacterized protein YgiM (DUF1202 family)
MRHAPHSPGRLRLALLMILLLAVSLGCSLGQMLVGEPTPTPSVTPPAPVAHLDAVAGGRPVTGPDRHHDRGGWHGLSHPDAHRNALLHTHPPPSTWTPLPTPVDTPTPTPAPYVLVVAPIVNVRSGPSVAYPIIGQAYQDQRYDIIARNEAFTWWQICCINGQQGWITTQLTAPGGPADTVPIVAPPDLPPHPLPQRHTAGHPHPHGDTWPLPPGAVGRGA